MLKGPTYPNPVMFLKRLDGIVSQEQKFVSVSHGDQRYVPECELGVLIGKKGKNIPEEDWLEFVDGYFILFDITEKGYTFGTSPDFFRLKAGDDFTPIGNFIPKSSISDVSQVKIELRVNDEQ